MVTNFVDIQRIIEEHYEQHCDQNFGHLDGIGPFLESHRLPEFTQGEGVR